ncbi:tetracycline resistance efflux system leader peptide [Sulfurimonas sp.]
MYQLLNRVQLKSGSMILEMLAVNLRELISAF